MSITSHSRPVQPPSLQSPANIAEAAAPQTITGSLIAIWLGATVDITGSVLMAISVPLLALMARISRGDSAERIVAELPQSYALLLFCALGGMLMSVAGGYAAAIRAGWKPIRHAAAGGLLATVMNATVLSAFGGSEPLWLTIIGISAILPCAAVGGWLAAPVADTSDK